MDRSARRVKAERNRRRLPRRGATARWARRIAGVLGTAALLGVLFASVQMVLPSGGEEPVSAATPSPTATPKPKAKKASKPKKPKGLTKAQKQAREDAVAEVRSQGFTTLKPTDYDPKATLRVLIARPVGDAAGGYRAFFFNKTTFIGNDARANSSLLRVSRKAQADGHAVLRRLRARRHRRPAQRPQARAVQARGRRADAARHDPVRQRPVPAPQGGLKVGSRQ